MDVLDQIEAEFFDEYGPAKLIHLHEPRVGLMSRRRRSTCLLRP
jgi:hypothetical protein